MIQTAIADANAVIEFFYPEDTALRRMLLKHSGQVRDKALTILERCGGTEWDIDPKLVEDGAMLHDIGILKCHAPKILCEGTEPYIAHGIIGARMLREFGQRQGCDMEVYARICERHTGSGLTAREVRTQGLPIPERDYLPETPEEKLICFADKFYSKSGDMREKPLDSVRHSMAKFGSDSLARFEEIRNIFEVK